MEVAIVLHEGVAAAEALGPFAVLRRLPGARMHFVAVEPGRYLAHDPPVELMATDWLGGVTQADVLVVPGGFGAHELMHEENLLEWVRAIHAGSQWTTAVSTGALVLAAAGVLDGVQVTTHWLAADEITGFGARPVPERLVEDGKVITAMGGLGAFELGLLVARHVAGDDAADEIRGAIGVDPEAFDPKQAAKLGLVVRRWCHEAEDTNGGPTSRWRRPAQRRRDG